MAEEKKNTIYVSGISTALDEDALRQFFSYTGKIKKLTTYGPIPGTDSKYATVEFTDAEPAKTCALLSGTVLLNKPIQIGFNPAIIPKALESAPPGSPPTASGPAGPPLGAMGILPAPTPAMLVGNNLGMPIPLVMVPAPVPPPPVSVPNPTLTSTSVNAQKAEEVARTVYVGNLNPKITPDQLLKFFSACGPVSFCRMAGDDTHPARFAFIEFETLPAAQLAMTLNGTQLIDRPIKVNHSKNPIVKPPPKPNDPRKEEDEKRALRRIQEALSRKVAAAEGADEDDNRDSRRKRSRSRSRSYSPRYRSRSRSRSRSRERRERRERDRRRDREERERERERERDRERARERERERERDRGDRDRRDRDRDRDRDRGKDRDKDSRDKERDRDRDRERDRHKDSDRDRDKDRHRHKRSRSTSRERGKTKRSEEEQAKDRDERKETNGEERNGSESRRENGGSDYDPKDQNDTKHEKPKSDLPMSAVAEEEL